MKTANCCYALFGFFFSLSPFKLVEKHIKRNMEMKLPSIFFSSDHLNEAREKRKSWRIHLRNDDGVKWRREIQTLFYA